MSTASLLSQDQVVCLVTIWIVLLGPALMPVLPMFIALALRAVVHQTLVAVLRLLVRWAIIVLAASFAVASATVPPVAPATLVGNSVAR